MRREYERVVCPGCQRAVSAYVPHCGDGTDVKIVKHCLVDPAKVRTRSATCPASGELLGEYKARRELFRKLASAPDGAQEPPR